MVEQNKVIFYKDIPRFFLDKRVPYNDLATEIRKRKIPYSWEFPEGLAFTFEGKKIKIRSLAEKQKFLDKHLEFFKGTPLDPAQLYKFPEVFPPPSGSPGPSQDPEQKRKERQLEERNKQRNGAQVNDLECSGIEPETKETQSILQHRKEEFGHNMFTGNPHSPASQKTTTEQKIRPRVHIIGQGQEERSSDLCKGEI